MSTASIFGSFLLSFLMFYESSICSSFCTVTLCKWFHSELFISFWAFYFDSVSVVMLLVVSGVSMLVHFYSIEYMAADEHQIRFLGYLSLFTGFMLILVSADNFIVMFFGWEGIGLSSFLLIGFWYSRIQAGKSAIKAMLVNRVGDVGLALAISSIFLTFKSVDYFVVLALLPSVVDTVTSFIFFDVDKLTIIALLIFWGALGKSAQLGLHIWLPDAMEGPTPVSALIHAATLVTAGIFLIIRVSAIFENSQSLFLVVIFGSLTAFFAASVGLVQNDLKRVIAFSTCSQLGYMTLALGLSHYSVAFFHLANHALFKALLFLSAGSIIHGLADEQDMRKMGGLIKLFPTTYATVLIGSLALAGFPFLTGFYSKDVILEIAASKNQFIGNFGYLLACTAAFCTAFYSFRLIFLTFINKSNTQKKNMDFVHDSGIKMVFPLFCLAFGAIFFGYFSRDMFIGFGSSFFSSGIINNVSNFNIVDSEFLPIFLKNLPFFVSLFGIFLSLIFINFDTSLPYLKTSAKLSINSFKKGRFFRVLYTFLSQKWHFDQITNEIIVVGVMNFGYKTSFKLIDKGNIETFGPVGLSSSLLTYSKTFSAQQAGFVFFYAFSIIWAMFISLTLYLYSYLAFFSLFDSSILCLLLAYLILTLKHRV